MMDGQRTKIIMVYPQMGFSGAFVLHAPLGLLYASVDLVKRGIDVAIVDIRLYPDDWQERLTNAITSEVLAVGISVMSGTPIKSAVEIGRLVKSIDPRVSIVWGGPHATFFPDTILKQEWYCDYVVSGNAVKSFGELVDCLAHDREPSQVPGISYRSQERIRRNPQTDTGFEFIDHTDIPYELIDDYSVYGQLDQKKKIFSMYSAMGCPYQCSFCSSPAEYANIRGPHWVPIDIRKVVDHIEYVNRRYGADYIYFIDNDSFVDLHHVEAIIDELNQRGIKTQLGFRGARINEIKRMDDAFLDKLSRAGTDILHIGAESGSDRMLALMRKNCTVDDIVECNKKLARHPRIIAAYNFIVGLPGETIDDMKATRDLMLRLVEDNPRCLIFQPNKFRPLPGTELFERAHREWGYKQPETLEEWAQIEAEGDSTAPWYTTEMKKFGDLLLIGAYFIDDKVEKVTSGGTIFYKVLRALNAVYGPIARFRLRHGLSQCLIEYRLYRIATRMIARRGKPAGWSS